MVEPLTDKQLLTLKRKASIFILPRDSQYYQIKQDPALLIWSTTVTHTPILTRHEVILVTRDYGKRSTAYRCFFTNYWEAYAYGVRRQKECQEA